MQEMINERLLSLLDEWRLLISKIFSAVNGSGKEILIAVLSARHWDQTSSKAVGFDYLQHDSENESAAITEFYPAVAKSGRTPAVLCKYPRPLGKKTFLS